MSRQVTWKTHSGPVLDRVRDLDVVACASCGFRHIVPIPTKEEIMSLYRDEYYTTEKPLYLERFLEDLDWWNLVYRSRYELFEGLLPSARRSILDIGSGLGFFLLHGKERGWNGVGVEPAKTAAAHARSLGLKVHEGLFDGLPARALGTFDVVNLATVLEHIADPATLLREARSLLSPGGLVCVVVPNDYNPLQLALREVDGYEPWWVAPPHHINYFDFATLRGLFDRVGLDVVHSEGTFPMELFLLMGENYVGNDARGRQCHGRRKRFETCLAKAGKLEVLRGIYGKLAELGLGREVVLIGKARP